METRVERDMFDLMTGAPVVNPGDSSIWPVCTEVTQDLFSGLQFMNSRKKNRPIV